MHNGLRTPHHDLRSAPMTAKTLKHWPLLCALLIAATLKAGLLYAEVVPFNADEAVVGLMARHILQGARPVFFYGQVYLGSLDAWLVAGAFALFGESVLAIRLVQVALYLGTIATTYWLGRRIYSSAWIANAAALFVAIPAVNVTLYTTATLGGYCETLLIGNILFLLTLHLARAGNEQRALPSSFVIPHWSFGWLLFGLLGGLGFWTFPLVMVYIVPAVIYLVVARRRPLGGWVLATLGFAAGAAPWWMYTLRPGAA